MKVTVLQQIESTTRGKPHMPGDVIEHPDAWRLCNIFEGGLPVAEPADDEAEQAARPDRERREKLREQLERHAEQMRQQQAELLAAEEAQRLADFEALLKGESNEPA